MPENRPWDVEFRNHVSGLSNLLPEDANNDSGGDGGGRGDDARINKNNWQMEMPCCCTLGPCQGKKMLTSLMLLIKRLNN